MHMVATTDEQKIFRKLFHQYGSSLTYKKGEFIIRPGETPSGIFFIESGLVKAYNITKYGEENLLIIRRENEVFPLIWAITGQERHVIYEALQPTEVRQLSRKHFLAFMHAHPEALSPLLDMVVEMYRIHSERIINLEYRTVRERLASFLVTMAQRFGATNSEGIRLTVPLRHMDIASSINASRETTSRELSALEKRKILRSEQGYMTLYDIDALHNMI